MKEHNLEKKFDHYIYLLLLGTITLIPLLIFPWASDQVLGVKYLFLKIFVALAIGIYTIKTIYFGTTIKKTGLELVIAILFLLVGISTILSPYHFISLEGFYLRYDGFISWCIYIALFFFASQQLKEQKNLEFVLECATVTAAFIGLYGVLQSFGFDPVPWGYTMFEKKRSFATLGNPIQLGAYLCLFLPISLALFLQNKESNKKILYGFTSFLIALCIVTTFSRAAWICSIFAVAVLIAVTIKRKELSFRTALAPAAIGIVVLMIAVLNIGLPVLSSRAASTFSLEGSNESRWLMWQSTTQMIKEKPLFGYGPDTMAMYFPKYESKSLAKISPYDIQSNVHNPFLQLAATSGLPAMLAFIFLLIFFFIKAIKFAKRFASASIIVLGVIIGIAAYIAQSFTGLSGAATTSLLWFSMGAVASQWVSHEIKIVKLNFSKGTRLLRYLATAFIIIFVASSMVKETKIFLSDYTLGQARLAELKGDINTAYKKYLSSINLNPNDSKAYNDVGRMLADNGAHSSNFKYWQLGMRFLGDSAAILPDYQPNQIELAKGYLFGARSFNPTYYKQSETHLKKAVELRPNSPLARGMLGTVYLETGKLNKAKKELNKALEINPYDTQALYYLGRYFEKIGDKTSALKQYKTVLAIDKTNKKAQDAMIALRGEK